MAKIQKSMTFSGAMIDVEEGAICEYNKGAMLLEPIRLQMCLVSGMEFPMSA